MEATLGVDPPEATSRNRRRLERMVLMHRHQFDSHNPRLPLPQKHAQQVVLHDHEVQLLTLAQKQGVVEGLIDASECCSWEGFSEPFVTRFIAREAVSRVEALWAVQCLANIMSHIDCGSELTVA